jgi:DNA polymerase delta subunit 1
MFDGNYIAVRCKMHHITQELAKLSRLKDYKAELVSAKFSSSAYGTSEYNRISIPGRINFDILIFIRREFKENSYKLDNIAEKYLKEKKNPVSVQEIFGAYETGKPDDIAKIGAYCVVDTLLPQKLVDVLYILQTQISMSNVTKVTIRMLIERGQEVKAISQIRLMSKRKGVIMQNCNYKTEQEGFEGATVLDPIKGIYDCITTLDFEGLYPSIIRAHNLCPTSIVLHKDYLNIEGAKYTKVKFSDEECAIFVENTETVLPDLLKELTMERKKYKKLMATADNKDLKEIYNRTQLAFKISSNSINE